MKYLSKKTRFAVLTRDKFTCRYCGRKAPNVELHVDHVHPMSRGGGSEMSNLVSACRDCNLSKNAKLIPLDALSSPAAVPARVHDFFVAHPDRCSACGWWYIEAHSAIERPDDGYVAFYTCPNPSCDHSWRTYWSASHRLTAKQAAGIVDG